MLKPMYLSNFSCCDRRQSPSFLFPEYLTKQKKIKKTKRNKKKTKIVNTKKQLKHNDR